MSPFAREYVTATSRSDRSFRSGQKRCESSALFTRFKDRRHETIYVCYAPTRFFVFGPERVTTENRIFFLEEKIFSTRHARLHISHARRPRKIGKTKLISDIFFYFKITLRCYNFFFFFILVTLTGRTILICRNGSLRRTCRLLLLRDRNTCETRINLWRSFILRAPKRAGPTAGRRIVLGRRGRPRRRSRRPGSGRGRGGRERGAIAMFVYGQNQRRSTNRKPSIRPAYTRTRARARAHKPVGTRRVPGSREFVDEDRVRKRSRLDFGTVVGIGRVVRRGLFASGATVRGAGKIIDAVPRKPDSTHRVRTANVQKPAGRHGTSRRPKVFPAATINVRSAVRPATGEGAKGLYAR